MKKQTRKSFLFAGLSLAAVTTFFKWGKQPEQPKNKVKFLTRDGKLVEIDADKLTSAKRPASKEEVQNWIKNK